MLLHHLSRTLGNFTKSFCVCDKVLKFCIFIANKYFLIPFQNSNHEVKRESACYLLNTSQLCSQPLFIINYEKLSGILHLRFQGTEEIRGKELILSVNDDFASFSTIKPLMPNFSWKDLCQTSKTEIGSTKSNVWSLPFPRPPHTQKKRSKLKG